MVASIHGSCISSIRLTSGMSAGLCSSISRASSVLLRAEFQLVHHRRRGGDQVQIIFAGQPFLNDFQVEQAQKTAAKAKAQRRARFHFKAEAGVVEAQLADAFAQFFKVRGISGEEAAEHHGLHFLEPGQRFCGGLLGVGDGITDAGLRDFLDLRGDEADFAGAEFVEYFDLGPHAADAVDQVAGAGLHELDLLALADAAVDDAHEDDDAQIGVVPAVDQHGFERRVCGLPWAGGCA